MTVGLGLQLIYTMLGPRGSFPHRLTSLRPCRPTNTRLFAQNRRSPVSFLQSPIYAFPPLGGLKPALPRIPGSPSFDFKYANAFCSPTSSPF